MDKLSSALSELKDILYPPDFDFWRYELLPGRSSEEFISFENLIKQTGEIEDLHKHIVTDELTNQIQIGIKRRHALKGNREFLQLSRILLYFCLLGSLVISLISLPWIEEYQTLLTCMSFGLVISLTLSTYYFSSKASKLGRERIEVNLSQVFHKTVI